MSRRLAVLGSIYSSGLKSLTKQPTFVGSEEVSNRSTKEAALRGSHKDSQKVLRVNPFGAITPAPVITARLLGSILEKLRYKFACSFHIFFVAIPELSNQFDFLDLDTSEDGREENNEDQNCGKVGLKNENGTNDFEDSCRVNRVSYIFKGA